MSFEIIVSSLLIFQFSLGLALPVTGYLRELLSPQYWKFQDQDTFMVHLRDRGRHA